MKKLLIITCSLLLFAACKKSGNAIVTNTNPATNLYGKWFYTTDTIKVYVNGALNSSTGYNYYNSDYLQFNSTGTGTELRDTTTTNFTFTLDGPVLTLRVPVSTVSSIGKPQAGTTFAVVQQYTNLVAKVKQLTATNLVLNFANTTTSGDTTTTEVAYLSK